jgi:hypothetical protein
MWHSGYEPAQKYAQPIVNIKKSKASASYKNKAGNDEKVEATDCIEYCQPVRVVQPRHYCFRSNRYSKQSASEEEYPATQQPVVLNVFNHPRFPAAHACYRPTQNVAINYKYLLRQSKYAPWQT